MKKVIIEFCRTEDGTRDFKVYYKVYREGEKKHVFKTSSQFEAFSKAQTLYASQGAVRGVAA